jgi:hypothetical protein
MNHRFKISTDWKPQRLPELVNTIHDIVRLHFADLKRALFGQGSYELECAFQHLYVPHTVWTSKTTTEKEKIFARFLKNRNINTKMIQSSDGKLTVPNVKRLARKQTKNSSLKDCYCCMTNSNKLYYIKYKLSDFIFISYIISS